MFNKAQRQELGKLSEKVYGTESAWKKLLEDPKYQIVTGTTEVDAQKYVQYQRKDGKPGTVVKLETAIEKYGFQLSEEQLNKKVTVAQGRPATFEELVHSLQAAYEIGVHSKLTKEELQHVLADMLTKNKLTYKLVLELGEGEQTEKSFNEQLQLLSEYEQNLIKEMLKTADKESQKGIPVDAYGFTSDVVFCKNHPEKATELSLAYLSDAEKRIEDSKKKGVNKVLHQKLYNDAVNKYKRNLNKKAKTKDAKSNRGNRKAIGNSSSTPGKDEERQVSHTE